MAVSISNIKSFVFLPEDPMLPGRRLTHVTFSHDGKDSAVSGVGLYFNHTNVSEAVFTRVMDDLKVGHAVTVSLDPTLGSDQTGILLALAPKNNQATDVKTMVFTALKDTAVISQADYDSVVVPCHEPVKPRKAAAPIFLKKVL